MILPGSALGYGFQNPPTFARPSQRRKSFIGILPSGFDTTTNRSNNLRLTRSRSVRQKDDTAGPSVSTSSNPSSRSAGMDFSSIRRQFIRGSNQENIVEGAVNGTILRAVPPANSTENDTSPASSTTSLVSSARMFKLKTKSRKGSAADVLTPTAVTSPSPIVDGSYSPKRNSSLFRDSILTPMTESEVHPDFLGVWNDGTAHWAAESEPYTPDPLLLAAQVFQLDRPTSPTMEELEHVPTRIERRSLRPKIQLTIPEARRSVGDLSEFPPLDPVVQPDETDVAERPHSASSMYSVTTHAFSNQSGHTTLRQSTLTQMMHDMTNFQNFSSTNLASAPAPTAATSTASLSASSDDHFDDDASSTFSGRSSVSSATMDVVFKPSKSRTASAAYSIVTPGLAGVYRDQDAPEMPMFPRFLQNLHSQMSFTDKPLPPEPLEMAPAPLTIAGRHCKQPNGFRSASPNPSRSTSPPTIDPPPMPRQRQPRPPPRQPSRGALKSKYSFSDLDAIDQAFQRTSPGADVLTLLEAEEALQLQLSTITESTPVTQGPFGWDSLPIMQHSPLQIARGPMEMAPSRAAPSPPPPPRAGHERLMKPEKKKSLRNVNVKTHITSQLKSTSRLQSSTPAPPFFQPSQPSQSQDSPCGLRYPENNRGKWSMKSVRSLGRGGMEQRASVMESSSPPNQGWTTLSTTPGMSSESSPVGDYGAHAAIQDLDKRLELLKMRERSEAFRTEAFRLADTRQEFQAPPMSGGTAEQLRPSLYRAPSVVVPRCDGPEALKRRRDRVASGVPSLVSLTVSDIPGWYANMEPSGSERPMSDGSLARADHDRNISADAAELVLLRILQGLDNLQDLFSAAVVSKGFYRIYKKNELSLMQGALKAMSTAAWELREMTPPFTDGNDLDCDRPVPDYTPQTYLRYYTRDMYIMVALKSLMLIRCESLLRPETVSALAGNDDERSLQLDDAFWRVWTFCKIFGSNKNRENDLIGQMDWLRGGVIAQQDTCSSSIASTDSALGMTSALLNPPESFGLGNGAEGLSPNQLWDMTEIWTCLRVLIQGFAGQREMAREFGVFGTQGLAWGDLEMEDALLDEWTSYLLTLGPSVVLDLAMPSDNPGPDAFRVAAESGWTDWETLEDGSSRSSFLTDAVTRVADQRMSAIRIPQRSHSRNVSSTSSTDLSGRRVMPLKSSERSPPRTADRHEPVPSHFYMTSPEIREQFHDDHHPTREWSPMLGSGGLRTDNSPSGGQRFNPRSATNGRTTRFPVGTTPQVNDPVDKAVWRLVEMGFSVEMAKRALAETDTGENLNVRAAIDICMLWTGRIPIQGSGDRMGADLGVQMVV